MRRAMALALAAGLTATGVACTHDAPRAIVIGAVYPLAGPQAAGGAQEYAGVRLAVDMVNRSGGVGGRPIQLVTEDAPGSDAAAASVDAARRAGASIVLGSYGSTISQPAAEEAARQGMMFWETGAVGDLTGAELGDLVFRVAPSGLSLGRSAVEFVARQLAPMLHRPVSSLRFAVANVDDLYGRAVARGAVDAVHAMGLRFAGQFPYDPVHLDAAGVVRRIARARPNVLFVSAYLEDGVALARETVRQHLHLVASIGTSSSYCMPMFGQDLGRNAVGLFASDKPDAGAINPRALSAPAQSLLTEASALYQRRYGTDMAAPALAGFSGAWALLHDVMPRAAALTPGAVSAAARSMDLPQGSLPNGSGVRFGAPGSPDAGANLEAASVIWEWVGVDRRAIVWPPAFATMPIEALTLAA